VSVLGHLPAPSFADFSISVIREISGGVLGFRFPMTAMSRDDGDYGDYGDLSTPVEADFAQDSPRFNLAFTISLYNVAIDSRNAD